MDGSSASMLYCSMEGRGGEGRGEESVAQCGSWLRLFWGATGTGQNTVNTLLDTGTSHRPASVLFTRPGLSEARGAVH